MSAIFSPMPLTSFFACRPDVIGTGCSRTAAAAFLYDEARMLSPLTRSTSASSSHIRAIASLLSETSAVAAPISGGAVEEDAAAAGVFGAFLAAGAAAAAFLAAGGAAAAGALRFAAAGGATSTTSSSSSSVGSSAAAAAARAAAAHRRGRRWRRRGRRRDAANLARARRVVFLPLLQLRALQRHLVHRAADGDVGLRRAEIVRRLEGALHRWVIVRLVRAAEEDLPRAGGGHRATALLI